MSEAGKGIVAILMANLVWGLSPIFYKWLVHVPPLEVLSHRTIWSMVFFGLVLLAQRRLHLVTRALSGPRAIARMVLASAMISVNWCLFIWSVQVGRVVEASLGYFIFPLVSLLFGVLFFAEPFGWAKRVAFLLALVAVTILTVGLGAPPFIALVLATSFGTYTALKKSTSVGPVVSVTAEVAILVPLALVWLWGVHNMGWTGITGRNLGTFGSDWGDSALLMLAGPMTAGPLILFSYASKRLSLATVGLMQYVNPSLQFSVAVMIFAEPFTRWHGMAFPLIWAALAVYSVQAIRQERSARRAAVSSGTSATTDTNPLSEASAKPSAMT